MRFLSSGYLLWPAVFVPLCLDLASALPGQQAPLSHELDSELALNWPHLPKYFTLPPLREQAEIQNAWTQERRDAIPALMRKHNISAWLVRCPHPSAT